MARAARIIRHPETWAILFLAAWPFIYFWPVTVGQSVWFTTDIIRLFYPFSVELARALSTGHLPLWTPGILGGFPLLAEGEVGALYPVNLVLFRLLPAHFALAYATLFHLAWAGCGMYAYVRSMVRRPAGALLAGFIFSFSSFVFGHLSHSAVIATISWLPWLLFFQNKFRASLLRRAPSGRWLALTALAFGIQFLPGSAQLAFLNSITFFLAGIGGEWLWNDQPTSGVGLPPRSKLQVLSSILLTTGLPGLLGAGIAASQLLPTAELVRYSVRGETSQGFFASYSLPLGSLAQFFWPFLNGEPAEATGEFWTYFGLVPLLLALVAPFLRRDRRTIAYFVFGLAALSLALGESNPAYALLYGLPLFGMFRVPARYLHLVIFAGACLSAFAFEAISDRWASLTESNGGKVRVTVVFALLTISVIGLAYIQSLEVWLTIWKLLPVLLALAVVAACVATATRKMAPGTLAALAVGLTVFDLASYAPPFLATIDSLTPASYVDAVPRSITALGAPRVTERVFTDLSVFPSIPALRGSLFPNTALSYGWASAQSYTSLAFARQEAYVFDPSPAMLNLMNVRFLMIPLEPRAPTKISAPSPSFGLDILDHQIEISPIAATGVELTSYTEQASHLPEGTAVGELVLRMSDGSTIRFSLRQSIETADWDAERKDAGRPVSSSRPQAAHRLPGYWRSFGKPFQGYTYKANFGLASPKRVVGITVHPLVPEARLVIESVSLMTEDGTAIPLSKLSGKNRFTLAYMSDTVAVWENQEALPRAFLVHSSQVLDDGAALARMRDGDFHPEQIVFLSEGQEQAEPIKVGAVKDQVEITLYEPDRVSVDISTDRAGYLVLADSWYPGWNVTVDSRPAPLYRADLLFRAVAIEPGRHTLVFEYRPFSFILGVVVSVTSLLVLGGLLVVPRFPRQSAS
ncbi:MAG TPA: YfhO family protein [Anaerolineae bacterium]